MKTAADWKTENNRREMEKGFEAAFIDSSVVADAQLKPSFLSNIPKEGKKVLSELEDLLLSCGSYL